MTVAQILRQKGHHVHSVRVDTPLMDALKLLAKHRIGAILVLDDDDNIAGVLSERDVARGLPEKGAALLKENVSALMTRDIITASSEMTIAEVMNLMTERRIRHLPVVDNGKLNGMITIGDVVKSKIAQSEHEAEALKAYIATG